MKWYKFKKPLLISLTIGPIITIFNTPVLADYENGLSKTISQKIENVNIKNNLFESVFWKSHLRDINKIIVF